MEKIYYGDNDNHFAELRLPLGDGPHPVAILIHGGFWKEEFKLSLMTDMAEDLRNAGWATWNIEYRRVGQSGGGWPETFQDVASACDHLYTLSKSYPLDISRVVTIGHSAGGHLALWTAARKKLPEDSELFTKKPLLISYVFSLAGVNDLQTMYDIHQFRNEAVGRDLGSPVEDFLKGNPNDFPNRYEQASPMELLPFGVPQVIVHGALDANVPIGISEKYVLHAKETGDDVTFLKLTDAEHFMLIDINTSAWKKIRDAVNRLLGMNKYI